MNKDIKLSNIKGLLIFLVVFGHLIEIYQKYYMELFLFIYSFHMPIFILVSGYFAKRASYRKIVNLLLIYLIFQPLYQIFLTLLYSNKIFQLKYEIPYFHLWYLVSMIGWYLMVIGFNKSPLKNINKVVLVAGCFLIGVASKFFTEPVVTLIKTYDPDFYSYSFSYQRTLSFLPFFFLGVFLTQGSMHKLYQSLKWKKGVSAAVIVGSYLYYSFKNITNEEKILKGSFGLDKMEGQVLRTSLQILMGYLIAIIMCYVLLNMISNKTNFLTKWGDRSLPIFLFHAFFIMIVKKLSFLKEINSWILLPILFLLALFILHILSTDLFMKYTYYLYNPLKALKLTAKKLKFVT